MTTTPSISLKSPGRRLFLTLAGGTLILALLATAYWHWAAGQIVTGLENWRHQQIARGFVVNYGKLELSGYPFSFDLSLSSPAISAPDGRFWQGPPMRGHAALWDPFTIDADAAGTHLFGGLKHIGELTGLAKQAWLQIHLAFNGSVDHAVTSIAGFDILHQEAQVLSVERLDAVLGPLRLADEGQLQELDFDGSAQGIVLPNDGGTPLGKEVESLSLTATLRGPLPAMDIRKALPIWREAGGEAIVHSADIAWGPLTLHAQGGATLDALMRPEGQFGTRISGLTDVLDALVARGQIKRTQAGLLSFALLSLGGGNTQQVALPITMKNGLLSAGPVPIAPLKPLIR
ncbi:DUF2125 domain-containing protein [Pelagibius sp. Alg239-R121]|uniref:DUF2125 domain-containing protein n=1 Tax=Pelagibius sp. Alg239-R121 TaxID=2993448 RepID=UPI0024A6CC61|nr:DUF2125 domain-containing protein [Pelagibius sp. Alg239-R121]